METRRNVEEEEDDDEGALDRLQGVSLVELLGAGDDHHLLGVKKEHNYSFTFSSFSSGQMICFGASEEEDDDDDVLTEVLDMSNESSLSVISSSSTASINKANRSRKTKVRFRSSSSFAKRATTSKKPKSTGSCRPLSRVRVRKEKLLSGRITALRQLISSFGRTDTVAVLHRAMEHIKLLHHQVQALSSPYLQAQLQHDLKSRGLCLMPVSCMEKVANSDDAYVFDLA